MDRRPPAPANRPSKQSSNIGTGRRNRAPLSKKFHASSTINQSRSSYSFQNGNKTPRNIQTVGPMNPPTKMQSSTIETVYPNQTQSNYCELPNKVNHFQQDEHDFNQCNDADEEQDYEDEFTPKINLDAKILNFNEDHIEFGSLIEMNLSEKFKPDQRFRLFLSQVQSPYKFWFQRAEDNEQIDSLMDHLE